MTGRTGRMARALVPAVLAAAVATVVPGQADAVIGGTGATTVISGTAVTSAAAEGSATRPPTPVVSIGVALSPTTRVRCSGVLVAPRVVVTARHCLHGQGPDAWSVELAAGTPSAQRRAVVELTTPADPGLDLAAARLDRPLGEEPVRLDGDPGTTAVGRSVLAGGPAVQYGYGSTRRGTANALSPTARAAGQRIDGPSPMLGVDHALLMTSPEDTGTVPGGACGVGDSGGPLVAGADGRGALVGIVSRGDDAGGHCWFERVDRAGRAWPWLARTVARSGSGS